MAQRRVLGFPTRRAGPVLLLQQVSPSPRRGQRWPPSPRGQMVPGGIWGGSPGSLFLPSYGLDPSALWFGGGSLPYPGLIRRAQFNGDWEGNGAPWVAGGTAGELNWAKRGWRRGIEATAWSVGMKVHQNTKSILVALPQSLVGRWKDSAGTVPLSLTWHRVLSRGPRADLVLVSLPLQEWLVTGMGPSASPPSSSSWWDCCPPPRCWHKT